MPYLELWILNGATCYTYGNSFCFSLSALYFNQCITNLFLPSSGHVTAADWRLKNYTEFSFWLCLSFEKNKESTISAVILPRALNVNLKKRWLKTNANCHSKQKGFFWGQQQRSRLAQFQYTTVQDHCYWVFAAILHLSKSLFSHTSPNAKFCFQTWSALG